MSQELWLQFRPKCTGSDSGSLHLKHDRSYSHCVWALLAFFALSVFMSSCLKSPAMSHFSFDNQFISHHTGIYYVGKATNPLLHPTLFPPGWQTSVRTCMQHYTDVSGRLQEAALIAFFARRPHVTRRITGKYQLIGNYHPPKPWKQ